MKTSYLKIYVCLLAFITSAFAGQSLTEFLAGEGIKKQIEASTLVLDVLVNSIEPTETVRDSGYLLYDDGGPFVKTKEQEILAHCTILEIQKNKTKLSLKENEKVVLTFWKQIKGKESSNYLKAWQKTPSVGKKILVLFLKDSVKEVKDKTILLPDFIHKSTSSKMILLKNWAQGPDENYANVTVYQKKLAAKSIVTLKEEESIEFTVKKRTDVRWNKWGKAKITVEKNKIKITIPTAHFTGIHIMNYIEGELSVSERVKLGLGEYEVYLGKTAIGKIHIVR